MSKKRISSNQTTKVNNELLVLGIVIEAGKKFKGVSVAEISRAMGVSTSTVNRIANRAVDNGCMKREEKKVWFNASCADKELIRNAKKAYKMRKSDLYGQMSIFERIEA